MTSIQVIKAQQCKCTKGNVSLYNKKRERNKNMCDTIQKCQQQVNQSENKKTRARKSNKSQEREKKTKERETKGKENNTKETVTTHTAISLQPYSPHQTMETIH